MLSLSSWSLVIVVWLFFLVPWVCLQFVIVIFPDHTHLLCFWCHSCEQRWLWRVCTFAWSSLSLHHSSKFSCDGSMGIECHFVRAVKAMASLHICTGLLLPSSLYTMSCAAYYAISVLVTSAADTLVSQTICAGKVTGQCDRFKITCAGSEGSWEDVRLHRLA